MLRTIVVLYIVSLEVFLMENFFDGSVPLVALIAIAFSLVLVRVTLSGKFNKMQRKVFDKSQLNYTDGDNT